ncbi:hypothetical protein [Kocuria rosea]|uniref:hypothetical protein n=1 Tax=Kocuria rosea TaxID=1275 RepID=UPI0035B073B4
MSRNDPKTGMREMDSSTAHALGITQAILEPRARLVGLFGFRCLYPPVGGPCCRGADRRGGAPGRTGASGGQHALVTSCVRWTACRVQFRRNTC